MGDYNGEKERRTCSFVSGYLFVVKQLRQITGRTGSSGTNIMTGKSEGKVYEDSISNWPEEERPRA